jgi:hypothetical protein
MTQRNAHEQPATKGDLVKLEERIAKLFSDGLQLIAEQFDRQNAVMATFATKEDLKSLESKLIATTATVKRSDKQLKNLKRALA